MVSHPPPLGPLPASPRPPWTHHAPPGQAPLLQTAWSRQRYGPSRPPRARVRVTLAGTRGSPSSSHWWRRIERVRLPHDQPPSFLTLSTPVVARRRAGGCHPVVAALRLARSQLEPQPWMRRMGEWNNGAAMAVVLCCGRVKHSYQGQAASWRHCRCCRHGRVTTVPSPSTECSIECHNKGERGGSITMVGCMVNVLILHQETKIISTEPGSIGSCSQTRALAPFKSD